MLWGCDKPYVDPMTGEPMTYDVGGKIYERCPLHQLKEPWIQEVLHLYDAYTKGILPTSGALHEQPALYVLAMKHAGALERSVEAHINEEHRKKMEAQRKPRV